MESVDSRKYLMLEHQESPWESWDNVGAMGQPVVSTEWVGMGWGQRSASGQCHCFTGKKKRQEDYKGSGLW